MLTPKQETFAVELAKGQSQAEAYRQAFPNARKWADKTVWSRASELAADGEVKGRVAELQTKAGAAKWTAERFRELTGWQGRCNEHARDAALLVWGCT